MPNDFELSRRKTLAALGTIGVASAGAGLGTSAYFSDQETFENNQLVAGKLDMKVSWEEHYSDWSEDEAQYAHMEDGELVIDDQQGFMNATLQERFPDKPSPPPSPLCETLADVPDDLQKPVIELEDVKPGDFGEVTFDFVLCDNPGYVWMNGELLACAENGLTEPEADDPDEDAMNAGFGSGLAGLVGSLAASRLETADEGDSDDGLLSKRNLLRGAAGVGVGAAGVGAFTGSAAAAVGDLLADPVGLPGHDSGVGIAFDGTYTYTLEGGFLTGDTLQVYDPPAGTGTATLIAEKDIVDGSGNPVTISSLDWDSGRGLMWGVSGDVWRLDYDDPTDPTEDVVATSEFTHSGPNFIDGFAYDGSDDTFWVSGDVRQTIYHHAMDGTEIGTVMPKNADGNNVGVSGVAVGADIGGRPTLYIGKHGPEKILRVYADDGTHVSDFAVEVGFRIEDLACDPSTYAPQEAIITKAAYSGQYKAYEVDPGTCLVGGVPDEPEPEPDECAGELQDALQVTIWHDENCDNLVDAGEEVVFEGSLSEAMEQLSSGNGIPLAGNIDAATGGGTGRDCYSATPDVHCIGFKWELPVDHGNEVQSDSVRFDLGFYTEQCRHNDGSGMMNTEG